jgi:hypothetical protein
VGIWRRSEVRHAACAGSCVVTGVVGRVACGCVLVAVRGARGRRVPGVVGPLRCRRTRTRPAGTGGNAGAAPWLRMGCPSLARRRRTSSARNAQRPRPAAWRVRRHRARRRASPRPGRAQSDGRTARGRARTAATSAAWRGGGTFCQGRGARTPQPSGRGTFLGPRGGRRSPSGGARVTRAPPPADPTRARRPAARTNYGSGGSLPGAQEAARTPRTTSAPPTTTRAGAPRDATYSTAPKDRRVWQRQGVYCIISDTC